MPSDATDQELIELWRDQPAPLLPLLHGFHNRDGFLSEAALRATSEALKIPLAELYGTVSFYHHFSTDPPGKAAPRVCTGNVCCLHGGKEILEALRSEGATAMPCAGRCDDMVPVIIGDEVRVGRSATELIHRPSALPAPNPGGITECCFASIREPGRARLKGYRQSGGYLALRAAIEQSSPAEIVTLITDSKLAGRGGAGFPTGVKWQAVAEAPGDPKTVVCNADEGEPGCFKDRALMEHDPHAVLEGMILAGFATGSCLGLIYLRYEYPEIEGILQAAIDESRAAGILGDQILGSDFSFEIHIRRGAGAYICGEEGSLLNSLEGKHPFPRNKPPFPVTHGFMDKPTAVNNVETLCSVPPIVLNGAQWYQSLGAGDHVGTKLISLSGDIRRPGNYEVPIGIPLRELLYDWAGGPLEGRSIRAVTMAGLSGGFIGAAELDTLTLDEPCIRSKGSFLGAGGIMVFDDTRDMVAAAHDAMAFFAHESCGKCFPCRIGTTRLTERLNPDSVPESCDAAAWHEEVRDIGATMKATSACGLGMAAPHITESLERYFPDQVERFLNTSNANSS